MPIPASSSTQAGQTGAAAKARGAEPCRSTQSSASSVQRPHVRPSPDEYVPFAKARRMRQRVGASEASLGQKQA